MRDSIFALEEDGLKTTFLVNETLMMFTLG